MCRASILVLIHASLFDTAPFVLVCARLSQEQTFSLVHKPALASAPLRRFPLPSPRMQTYTPQHKHTIISHYRACVRGAGFAALARRFAVQGGASAIQRWHQRWGGTPQSLQHKKGAGRPRVLSRREVQQHVRAPILRANRAHKAVHYPTILHSVRTKTGKQIALRTLQDYGKKELGAKQRRGKKRTADESESQGAPDRKCECVLHVLMLIEVDVHFLLSQCLLICVSRSRRCDASCSASASSTSSSSMKLTNVRGTSTATLSSCQANLRTLRLPRPPPIPLAMT